MKSYIRAHYLWNKYTFFKYYNKCYFFPPQRYSNKNEISWNKPSNISFEICDNILFQKYYSIHKLYLCIFEISEKSNLFIDFIISLFILDFQNSQTQIQKISKSSNLKCLNSKFIGTKPQLPSTRHQVVKSYIFLYPNHEISSERLNLIF